MPHRIPEDWFAGQVPDNVVLEMGSYLETSHAVSKFRSLSPQGLRLRTGAAAYGGTVFDVGPDGSVDVGQYALLNSVQIICDGRLEIGDHALLSWNVLIMDSYREPLGPEARLRHLAELGSGRSPSFRAQVRPVRIGPNTWIGFDSCILPGVTVGEGSVVGARSVVTASVPPYTVVAGNPARVVRLLDRGEAHARG
jgi:acetyltransferase-like isoleucine patch superfamily enzyme